MLFVAKQMKVMRILSLDFALNVTEIMNIVRTIYIPMSMLSSNSSLSRIIIDSILKKSLIREAYEKEDYYE